MECVSRKLEINNKATLLVKKQNKRGPAWPTLHARNVAAIYIFYDLVFMHTYALVNLAMLP